MKTFAELKRNSARDMAGSPVVRLAVLADSASQFLGTALRGAAYDRGVNLEVYEAPYRRVADDIFDRDSALYSFRPDFTLVWQAAEQHLAAFRDTPLPDRAAFADARVDDVSRFVTALRANSTTKVIYLNAIEIDDAVFGSFATRVPSSWIYQIRRFNYRLMELAADRGDFLLGDLALAAAAHGRAFVEDARIAATIDVRLSLDFLPVLAERVMDIVDAARGRARKCLILDLDNTLWGGVIGDDGLERIEIGELGGGKIFSEIQAWAKALKERGIILAVASKNDHAIASEPFRSHPEMTLRLDDIAVFVANWEQKASNITHIQSTLEIGFDSMVFLDDNPVERAAVRLLLPDVCVPELPDDPADWLPMLREMNLFETAAYTTEDSVRTLQYQAESARRSTRAAFADTSDFLRSLEMTATIEGFTPFNLPRVAQLTQRSNQFNLRTVRYDEAALAGIGASASHIGMAVTLDDRFGSHGLISVLILEDAGGGDYFIDTWLMSCRVLQRGVESVALNAACDAVKHRGGARLVAEYIPTAKNALVKDHYRSLGFTEHEGRWYLALDRFADRGHFINVAPTP